MPTGKKINAFFTTKKKIYDFLAARKKNLCQAGIKCMPSGKNINCS